MLFRSRFHWHLTDFKGWRIEIDKYPKLAAVGGIGDETDSERPAQFYTKAEIRDIIEYARERGITVIPEIDMPGHASAANRAYPEHSGGGSRGLPDSTFNPADPRTISYLQGILQEVSELFPGPWIHFGGDEVGRVSAQWPDLEAVQALMEREGYDNVEQVEHHFYRRMSRYINELGKTTIGWDETVAAGLPQDECIVMWWRHNRPRVRNRAMKKSYKLVLCPRIPMYFDFVQHESHKVGRRWAGKFCTLEQVYDYPHLPDFYEQSVHDDVVGIQANIWTALIWNEKRLDFMVFPRIAALAEAAWTRQEHKQYPLFVARLKSHYARYDTWNIYYFNHLSPSETPEPTRD